jgi:hypothetical protein
MPDVHVLDVEEDLLPPITLTRVPARSPAFSSFIALQIRNVAGAASTGVLGRTRQLASA